jgi:hypothetical protein
MTIYTSYYALKAAAVDDGSKKRQKLKTLIGSFLNLNIILKKGHSLKIHSFSWVSELSADGPLLVDWLMPGP